jgi:hypothetical protein
LIFDLRDMSGARWATGAIIPVALLHQAERLQPWSTSSG